jgi:hypothetical protein
MSLDEQVDVVKKLKELHDGGLLTDEEFAAKKQQVMGLSPSSAAPTSTGNAQPMQEEAVPRNPGPPTSQPPAGWYPDPQGLMRLRYWDGSQWTEHTAD